jgi:formylglycine-generating enzyme required for sulfatase activity
MPAGADVFYVPLDEATGAPRPQDGTRATAGTVVDLTPGYYLVVANLPKEGRFHEVFRYVPEEGTAMPDAQYRNSWDFVDGVIRMFRIKLPAADVAQTMALFPGTSNFTMGSIEKDLAPVHHRTVPAFYLDRTEVTVGQFRAFRRGFAYPGGRTTPPADHPVACVSWADAVAFAESYGKRLPDEAEYEFAATAGGTRRFPWGNQADPAKPWTFGPAGEPADDYVEGGGGTRVYGLYSNVAEWTSSWAAPYPGQAKLPSVPLKGRVVRGGGPTVYAGNPDATEWLRGPRQRSFVAEPVNTLPGLGFRCARSAKPRMSPEDFGQIIK